MNKYIIVTESGSDLPENMVQGYPIHVLPMHVIIEKDNYLDGALSIDELCDYYDQTGKVPTTSAVNPEQYLQAFEKIRLDYPDSVIIHISYSSEVSSTFQNAVIASDEIKNVFHVDALNVSAGLALIVMKAAKLIEMNPEIMPEELISHIKTYVDTTRFFFTPVNLEYLRAGGRVSNAQYLGASLLKIKPLIEIQRGKLISTKKYRGSMKKVMGQMIGDFFSKFEIDKNEIFLIYLHKIDQELKERIENQVRALGVKEVVWLKGGCVITCHGGPNAIGIAGQEIVA